METLLERLIEALNKAFEQEQALHDLNIWFRENVLRAKNMDEVNRFYKEYAPKYDDLRKALVNTLNEAMSLAKELLQTGGGEPPSASKPVKPGDVANQLRNLMDSIQLDSRQPRAGETATTLKNLEVELKGLIVIKDDEAQIVPPSPGSQVDPGLLSTIRLTFGAVPVLRPSEKPTPIPPKGRTRGKPG